MVQVIQAVQQGWTALESSVAAAWDKMAAKIAELVSSFFSWIGKCFASCFAPSNREAQEERPEYKLQRYIQEGNLEQVQKMCQDPAIERATIISSKAWHFAIEKNQFEIFEYFYNEGFVEEYSLFVASQYGNLRVVKEIMENGLDPKNPGLFTPLKFGRDALFAAISLEYDEKAQPVAAAQSIVEYLLQSGRIDTTSKEAKEDIQSQYRLVMSTEKANAGTFFKRRLKANPVDDQALRLAEGRGLGASKAAADLRKASADAQADEAAKGGR